MAIPPGFEVGIRLASGRLEIRLQEPRPAVNREGRGRGRGEKGEGRREREGGALRRTRRRVILRGTCEIVA